MELKVAQLEGKTAIITGASAGIGEATAMRLSQAGAVVVLVARREEKLDLIRDKISAAGGRAISIVADVTLPSDRQRIVDETLHAFGRIDVLVNNAGYGQRGPIELLPLELIRKNFETNFFSLVGLTQLVIPIMRQQGGGRIVNVSSVAGKIARPFSSVYDSTKHALEAVSDGLRGELAPFDIKVIIIEPGFIATEFQQVAEQQAKDAPTLDAGPYAAAAARSAAGREKMRKIAGSADDIAKVILRSVVAKKPKTRYATPGHAKMIVALRRFLPDRVIDAILNR